MSKQEFYDEWKSKILQIPGLPLENDTAATFDQSLQGANNISGSNWSLIGVKMHPFGQTGTANQMAVHGEVSKRASRTFTGGIPREDSLAESIIEEDGFAMRDKIRNAYKQEHLQSQKIARQLGVKNAAESGDVAGANLSQQLSSGMGGQAAYQLFKVSDLFKSALIGNQEDKKKAVATLFKYRKGASVISPGLCQLYTPNESKSRYQEPVEYLRCVNCLKSMNSHLYLKFKTAISDRALEYTRGMRYYEEMLMDKDIVVLIGTGLNLKGASISNTDSMLNMFLQQLSTCGLKVKDIVKMGEEQMKTSLYSKYLVLNCPLDEKDNFEDYINHPEVPDSQFSKVRISQIVHDISNIKEINKNDNSERYLRRVQTLTLDKMPQLERSRVNKSTQKLQDPVYHAVLLTTSQSENYSQLKATLKRLEPIFTESGIRCFGSSADRREAIIDKQVFFSYLYQTEKKINLHLPSKDKHEGLFEEINQFHDICELNSTLVVHKEFKTLSSLEVEEAFKKHAALKDQNRLREVMADKPMAVTLTYNFLGIAARELGKQDQHIYRVTKPDVVDSLSKIFFLKGETDFKLSVLVLRPFVVSNSLEELFLNVYRINKFNILQRVYKKLEPYELNYLAKIENIESDCFENYCKMMTMGLVCVVAVSNYSGIQLASFLADGYRDIEGASKYSDNSIDSIKSDTSILVNLLQQSKKKRSSEVLEDFLNSDSSSSYIGLNNMINYSYAFYHDLAYQVVPNLQEEHHVADRMLNTRRVYKAFETYREFASNSSFFNQNLFVPDSELRANELISIFLPQVLTKSSGLVVIHPRAIRLYEDILVLLKSMGFDITWESQGFLKSDLYMELCLYYQKRGMAFNADALDIQWTDHHFRMVRVSRVAGKVELRRLLYKLSLELTTSEAEFTETINRENAYKFATLCNDEVLENFFYKTALEQPPIDLRTNDNHRLSKQVKLVNFVLAELSSSAKVVPDGILSFSSRDRVYQTDSTESVISVRATTTEGDVEVRVTSITTDNLAAYEQTKKLGLSTIRMFYEAVSRNYLQKVPSFSHSRLIAYEIGLDSVAASESKINKMVIEVEEDMGPEFPYEIMYQIDEYLNTKVGNTFADELPSVPQSQIIDSQRADKSKAYASNKSYINNKSRGSLISFVWGSLLATYVKKLELTGIKIPLKHDHFKDYRKKLLEDKHIFSDQIYKIKEQERYWDILDRLTEKKDIYDRTTLRVIENKLKLLFQNEVYSLFREEEVMIYAPKFIDVENLRIFRKDSHLKLEHKDHKVFGESVMPSTGVHRDRAEVNFNRGVNSDYALQNVECSIYGRYRVYCQMDFLCECQLPEFVNLNGGFLKGYECVIAPALLEGYRENYKIHPEDQAILEKLYEEHQKKHKQTAEMLEERRKLKRNQDDLDYQRIKHYEEKKPLDVMQMEKFLYYLDLIDRYFTELNLMKSRLTKFAERIETPRMQESGLGSSRKANVNRFADVFKTAKAINLSIMRESMTETQKLTTKTCFTSEDLCRARIQELSNMIFRLLEKLSIMDLGFKGVETYLEEDTKMFIERDRYFIPLDRKNYVYDITDERYMVDLNKPEENHFFEKFKLTKEFIDETRLDRQQQKWFRRTPMMAHMLRPVDKEEEGIFVENPIGGVQRRKDYESLTKDFVYYKTIDL